jgi:3-(3-hydroxy-phenyl)propionate hydroxylase
MIRTPDIWRIAMTTQAEDDSAARGTIEEPAADFVAAINLLLKLIPGTTLADLDLKQYEVYRSHQRVAAEFSSGRVALAGDAAHLTSTNGGMGLNSGVQDAAALVTALLAAIAENSTEPITSYASARKQFCERFLQPTTTANHETVDNPDQATRAARLAKLAAQAADPAQELAAVAKASMLTDLALQN